MNPDPALANSFQRIKEELVKRGLTPRHPLKRNTDMATKKSTTTDSADEKPAKKKIEKKSEKTVAGYTLADMAKDLKTEGVEVRKALRGLGEKKPDSGRWGWSSKESTNELRGRIQEWLSTDGRKDNPGRPPKKAASKKDGGKGAAEGDAGAAPAKKSAKKAPAKKSGGKKLTKKGA